MYNECNSEVWHWHWLWCWKVYSLISHHNCIQVLTHIKNRNLPPTSTLLLPWHFIICSFATPYSVQHWGAGSLTYSLLHIICYFTIPLFYLHSPPLHTHRRVLSHIPFYISSTPLPPLYYIFASLQFTLISRFVNIFPFTYHLLLYHSIILSSLPSASSLLYIICSILSSLLIHPFSGVVNILPSTIIC